MIRRTKHRKQLCLILASVGFASLALGGGQGDSLVTPSLLETQLGEHQVSLRSVGGRATNKAVLPTSSTHCCRHPVPPEPQKAPSHHHSHTQVTDGPGTAPSPFRAKRGHPHVLPAGMTPRSTAQPCNSGYIFRTPRIPPPHPLQPRRR